MNSSQAETCLYARRNSLNSKNENIFLFLFEFSLVSSCRSNPVHLFDAYTGQVRASYKALNHLVTTCNRSFSYPSCFVLKEELVAAYSLGFELQTGALYCGYDRIIRAFDLQRPGPCVAEWKTFGISYQFNSSLKTFLFR